MLRSDQAAFVFPMQFMVQIRVACTESLDIAGYHFKKYIDFLHAKHGPDRVGKAKSANSKKRE